MTTTARRGRQGQQGWLGGTFDPIHHGHLDVARAAFEALELVGVTLVPSHVPPHRAQPLASAEHRVAMATLAANVPWLDVSTIEIDADGPSYTATTMDRLESDGIDLGSLVVIAGADAFAGILGWHRAESLLKRVSFAVVARPGHPATALRETLPTLASRMCAPGDWAETPHPCIVLVDAPTSPVSSTQVRAAVADCRSIEGLVPGAVEAYITAHGLYGGT